MVDLNPSWASQCRPSLGPLELVQYSDPNSVFEVTISNAEFLENVVLS